MVQWDRWEKLSGYKAKLSSFYNEARRTCAKLEYCYDFVDLFKYDNLRNGMYADQRHLNDDGNQILAQELIETLIENGHFKEH